MSHQSESKTARSGYPLSAIFMLIALCAVLAGVAGLGARAEATTSFAQVMRAVVGLAVYGALVGAIVGLFHFRRWLGAGCGSLIGATLGALVGPTLLVTDVGELLGMYLGGSVLVVVSSALVRVAQKSPLKRMLKQIEDTDLFEAKCAD